MDELETPQSSDEQIAARLKLSSMMTNRRDLLKKSGILASAGGLAVLGGAIAGPAIAQAATQNRSVTAQPNPPGNDTLGDILNIATTAERIAVTFYTSGVINQSQLGLNAQAMQYLKAALIEEQTHELLFEALGGTSLQPSNTFAFPAGIDTFLNLGDFIATQQALEGVFDAAFITAVRAMAAFGQQGDHPPTGYEWADLAATVATIAMIESEHRVLGRIIIGGSNYYPADNWIFGDTQGFQWPSDAAAAVQQAGFFNPTSGNAFVYAPVYTGNPAQTYYPAGAGYRLQSQLQFINGYITSRTIPDFSSTD